VLAVAGLAKVVVVGASLAGLRAAEALRKGGFDGRLTLVGAEPHLPYDRPPLSKQVLAGEWDADRTLLRGADAYGDLDLDLRLGLAATSLDVEAREVTLAGSERLPFDGLVIATGASPRELPGTPDLEGIHLLRTLDDSLAIRSALAGGPHVVVVGAGFIGSEVAASCRGHGVDVTILEALPVPLSRALGPDMGRACVGLHEDHGVTVRCGVAVAGFEGNGRVEAIRLGTGEIVPADLVVVGIGVAPETTWLEGSGLELDDGVLVDDTCATAVPGVVAAGDVARWPSGRYGTHLRVEHWTNAAEQGRAAGRRLLADDGTAERFDPVPFFWSDQYDTTIQFSGYARADDQVRVVRGSVEERSFVALYGDEDRCTGVLGFDQPRVVNQYRRLLAGSGRGAPWEDAMALADQ